MSKQEFLLVVYDISSDRRRTKLHNALLDFGTPVQYSVFECWLDKKEQAQLKRIIERIVRPQKQDSVRYYHLCTNCMRRIEVLGGAEITGEPPAALVVGDAGRGDKGGVGVRRQTIGATPHLWGVKGGLWHVDRPKRRRRRGFGRHRRASP